VLGRLEKSLLGPPIPVVATFQVELIRLGLRPRGAELRRARPGGRLRPKAPDDAGDDVFFDWIDVVDGVLVPLRPDLSSVGDVDELEIRRQLPVVDGDVPDPHPSDSELLSRADRIDAGSPISRDRTARYHAETGDSRKRSREALGDRIGREA